MIRKLLTATIVLMLPALAFANPGTAGWTDVTYVRPAMDVLVPDIDGYEAENHRVVDLTLDIPSPQRWTTAGVDAYFQCCFDPQPPVPPCCGTFWEHPGGGDGPPNPLLFGAYGLLAYDSFYTTPEDWPSTTAFGNTNIVSIASDDCSRFAEWYVTPEEPNVDGGLYTLARYNFTVDCDLCPCPPDMWCVDYDTGFDPCCCLVIEGNLFSEQGGGTPYPFAMSIPVCWCIPEPGSLGLLALGALALIRRR